MHEGHRQRMRERISSCGLDSLQDHEVLEYMLYFVQPRINVNETAHRLIDTFGSLNGVFDATPEELVRVKGIGEISAQFLTLLPDLFQRYWRNRSEKKHQIISLGKILEEFQGLFLGAKVEKMAAVFLNYNHEIIRSEILSVGSRYEVRLHPKELLMAVIRTDADFVILSHNHPNYNPNPSAADWELTIVLKRALNNIGVGMVDHLIVCPDDSYYSFLSDPAFSANTDL